MKVKSYVAILFFTIIFSSSAFANLPYHPIQFPRDDAGHLSNTPYNVKDLTEWWYYSGKLTTQEGRHFGYYFIVFNITKNVFNKRMSIPVYTLQLTDIDKNKVYGNLIFYPNSETQFSTKNLDISLGKNKDVQIQKRAGVYNINALTHTKQGPDVKLSLSMKPLRHPLFIGANGLIPMGNNTNSYYYSFTRMTTRGTLQIGNEKFMINPAQSSTWMDHQWGDFMISGDSKWFWTSIRLDNNMDINLTNVLDDSTKAPGKIKMSNILMPNGKVIFTTDFTVKQINHDPYHYPLAYDITIKPIQLKLHLTSLADNQDSNTFWEGISRVDGTYQGKPVHGFTYVENTSKYGRPLALFLNGMSSKIQYITSVVRGL